MEEVKLPLSEGEAVHQITLNGQIMTAKTNYGEEVLRVELDGEEWIIDVPLMIIFEFRSNRMTRSSRDTWSVELKDNSVSDNEFIILKMDKNQVRDTTASSKYLSKGEDSDVVLNCGHYKLNVNKERIGAKSTYFKALFNHDFKEKYQEEISIEYMDSEALHSVLMLSDDARFRLTDFNIERIMNAADFFGMDSLIHKCADHLAINSKIGEFKRLQLLDRYNQDKSIDELMSSIKSKMSIREDKEFDKLSDGSQLKILREAIKELKQSISP